MLNRGKLKFLSVKNNLKDVTSPRRSSRSTFLKVVSGPELLQFSWLTTPPAGKGFQLFKSSHPHLILGSFKISVIAQLNLMSLKVAAMFENTICLLQDYVPSSQKLELGDWWLYLYLNDCCAPFTEVSLATSK